MYFARMFKTLPACGLLLQRSNRLHCSQKLAKNFPIQISHSYCSISASNTQTSTLNDPDLASLDDVSLDSLIQMIKSNLSLKHGSRYNYDYHNINGVVEYLLEFNDVKKNHLMELFIMQPSLCQYYCKSWENSLAVLHGNGLPVSSILKMLEICPQLLKRNPTKMDETFICLREHQFCDKNLIKLITKAPQLLTADAHCIVQKIKQLMTLFTQKDIQKLVLNSPQVMLEDFEAIEDKVRYIFHEIGVEQNHIISCSALSHSLHHIQLRHQVMLRTGIYRKPHPKKKINNPSLSVMLNVSTKTFTEDICEISLEEYNIFEKMLERENFKRKAMEGASDSESDSESESEDDDF